MDRIIDVVQEIIDKSFIAESINKFYFEVGMPIDRNKSSFYDKALKRLEFPPDDNVYLLYESSSNFKRGLVISTSGLYFKGKYIHRMSWKDFSNVSIGYKMATLYIDGDTFGGTPGVDDLAYLLEDIRVAVCEILNADGCEETEEKISNSNIVSDQFANNILCAFSPFLRVICGNKVVMKEDNTLSDSTDIFLSEMYRLSRGTILFAFNYERNFKMNFAFTSDGFYWKYLGDAYYIKYTSIKKIHIKKVLFAKIMQLEYMNESLSEELYLTGIDNSEEFVRWFSFFLSLYKEMDKYQNMDSPMLVIQNNANNDLGKLLGNTGFPVSELVCEEYDDEIYIFDLELYVMFIFLFFLEKNPFVIHAEIIDEEESLEDENEDDELFKEKEDANYVISDVSSSSELLCNEKKSMMMYCVFCGQSIQSNSRFCCFCGKENPYVK